MNKKKKTPEPGKEEHSESLEMFDEIFRGNMDMEERRIEREKAAWGRQNLSESTEMIDNVFREDLGAEKKSPEAEKPDTREKPSPAGAKAKERARRKEAGAEEGKPETNTPLADKKASKRKKRKIKSRKRAARKSSSSRARLLLLLLVVLGGAALHHYRIVDFGVLPGYLGDLKKVGVQLYDQGKAAVKAATKHSETTTPAVEKPAPKKPAPVPQPAKPATRPPAVAKPEPLEKPETPPKRIVVVTKKEVVKSKSQTQPAVSSRPVQIAPKRASEPVEKNVSYPYVIYLGSYSDPKYLQEAMSEYRDMGLSPYWVKVDLGNKGVWRRIFAGHFQTKREADAFIREKRIPDAESKHVNYATLIGVYASEQALERKRSALMKLGYSPYVIPGGKGDYRLYVGAFYRKVSAEKLRKELASQGIRSQIVKR